MGEAKRKQQARAAEHSSSVGPARRQVFARARCGVVAIVQPLTAPKGTQATSSNAIPVTMFGSGFFVEDKRTVVTAAHVVEPWLQAVANKVKGVQPPGVLCVEPGPGSKVGDEVTFTTRYHMVIVENIFRANNHDLAILRLSQTMPGSSAAIIKCAQSGAHEGDEIGVCGFPLGRDLHGDLFGGAVIAPSFSVGVISAILPHPQAHQEAQMVYQLDAMISGGHSGGLAFDLRTGEAVGVVTAMGVTSRKIVAPGGQPGPVDVVLPTGLGRCVPIHVVNTLLRSKPWLAGPPSSN